ncbi:MAG: single-stranded-DNA-specific exonuclease RecJ [Methylomonas sp.]|nr:single-stranded-DNA-specific exonuclease RecJ [Methylomonas sp.]PPD21966.1 MAG: single-stranded-DNA-specific exonuclease RecJ [Methylomonas sp.]PPD25018.1 MAG: single-stranded-DNA-specific exonuclease RecJ [Methylomonas sp.]PPD34358.1 MAG: single-stranded-DNA-specific exonuclease RecJ [Methylomonas sp.]PPD39195.1 MAG: single-stranded-DNA-specific exonuclease RecJ [Methylomonas sp.]
MYLQSVKKTIQQRPALEASALSITDPVLRRIFASRGVRSDDELDRALTRLPSPWLLSGMQAMVDHLVAALNAQKAITVVADFDADGATACALAIKGLTLLGAQRLNFIVPNRFEYGYGLTPEIVELTKLQQAQVIITVDNGISSLDGVQAANAAGIQVLVTDHHLPGDTLPAADAIVNPNLPGDKFPSRNIAGVGVMFYVLMALRIRLRERHWFEKHGITEPNLAQLLDYVALGTVADVVTLDRVNRILVHQGLSRIRAGRCQPGIRALAQVAGRSLAQLASADLGFAIAPRLNAAGRMDDMALGIRCLLTDDDALASDMAVQLDALNQDRKTVEGQMRTQALALLADMRALDEKHLSAGVCLYDADWHQGVIGILAARIKDRLHRPVIAFAPADNGDIKGSARSIPGVHIRDVLADIAARYPKLLSKFGGHAMAAGLSLKLHDYPPFALAFAEAVAARLDQADLDQKVWSDGQLTENEMTLDFADSVQNAATWGQGFPEPVFDGVFDVIQCRIVGRQHLKFVLRLPFSALLIDAIAFFADQPENWLGCRKIVCAYRLDANEFRNQRNLQLQLHYVERWE